MHPNSISEVGLDLIKQFEGCHRIKDGKVHSYRDPVGVWTIGYGHTKGVRSGQVITMEQAEDFLREDVEYAESWVKSLVNVPLTQHQFDALVSFVFNLGPGNFKSSTLLKLLNKGQYEEVPEQLSRWNKGRVNGNLVVLKGLVRRRSAEGALFMMDTPLASEGGERMPQKILANDRPGARRKTRLGGVASAGIGVALSASAEQIQSFVGLHDAITYAFLGLTILGVIVAVYGEVAESRETTL